MNYELIDYITKEYEIFAIIGIISMIISVAFNFWLKCVLDREHGFKKVSTVVILSFGITFAIIGAVFLMLFSCGPQETVAYVYRVTIENSNLEAGINQIIKLDLYDKNFNVIVENGNYIIEFITKNKL